MLNNIKTKERGFTLVELLIVIVVIAILAAITIVAYNGIQNRAKTSAGQSLANSVTKKVQAYNTLTGQYPSNAQIVASPPTAPTGYTGTLDEAKLDNPSAVKSTIGTDSAADSGKAVAYVGCGTTGGKVGYWDFTASPHALVWSYLGDATSTSTGCA